MEVSQSDSAPRRRSGTGHGAPGSGLFRRFALLAFAFLLMATLIGVSFVVLQGRQLEEREYSNLESIARLKAEQIENWLQERSGDASTLHASMLPLFSVLLKPPLCGLPVLLLGRYPTLLKRHRADIA